MTEALSQIDWLRRSASPELVPVYATSYSRIPSSQDLHPDDVQWVEGAAQDVIAVRAI